MPIGESALFPTRVQAASVIDDLSQVNILAVATANVPTRAALGFKVRPALHDVGAALEETKGNMLIIGCSIYSTDISMLRRHGYKFNRE